MSQRSVARWIVAGVLLGGCGGPEFRPALTLEREHDAGGDAASDAKPFTHSVNEQHPDAGLSMRVDSRLPPTVDSGSDAAPEAAPPAHEGGGGGVAGAGTGGRPGTGGTSLSAGGVATGGVGTGGRGDLPCESAFCPPCTGLKACCQPDGQCGCFTGSACVP
jgi:hypothetical protein